MIVISRLVISSENLHSNQAPPGPSKRLEQADRPRKKIITNLNNLFYVFPSYSMSNAPKTMELHFPRASRSSHLPSILPFIAATSFWLVVVFKIIDRRPLKAVVYFILILYFFVAQFATPNDGMVSPHALPAQHASALTPHLPVPLTIRLIVVCHHQTAAT